MPTVSIQRDPFARGDVVRRTVETNVTCAWCGSTRKSGKLFQYGWEDDQYGSRTSWQKEVFCSADCMRNYHDREDWG